MTACVAKRNSRFVLGLQLMDSSNPKQRLSNCCITKEFSYFERSCRYTAQPKFESDFMDTLQFRLEWRADMLMQTSGYDSRRSVERAT